MYAYEDKGWVHQVSSDVHPTWVPNNNLIADQARTTEQDQTEGLSNASIRSRKRNPVGSVLKVENKAPHHDKSPSHSYLLSHPTPI